MVDITKEDPRDILLDKLSLILEEHGQNDPHYDDMQKSRDILDVLESMLAFAIFNTCISPETIRDSAEESYVNIKKLALMMFEREQAMNVSKKAS